eukprot:TRINITY_DN15601_c0_g1_i1.p1 TRINITY_DN15601_c0_g1~~TRINITY_DN15601_c0_g1_i1.p1  ORF type:complete len:1583 (-),score=323.11 TRINITY_DN15601_c0_g1_i1:34-4782(-)
MEFREFETMNDSDRLSDQDIARIFASSTAVIARLWRVNPAVVARAMVGSYNSDPSCLPRLLDIAQDLNALSQILELRPFIFAVDLAALAGRREYLNLEKWLQEHLHDHKDPFARACIVFLKEKILRVDDAPRQGSNIQLSFEVMLAFFKCLLSNQSHLSKEVQDELKAAHSQCSKVYPRLEAVAENVGSTETFAPEIESEANTQFQQLFAGNLGVSELVEKLKMFMVSPVMREQKVYACIIRNLFDECRFFHKYPDKELRISGTLFGCLIQHQLITALWLGIALRYVLDSLKKQVNSKMFKFGLYALEQFRSRLPEWPQYCTHIDKIEHLRQVDIGAEILDQIKVILQEKSHAGSTHEVAVPAQMPASQQTEERRSNFPGLPVAPPAAQGFAPPLNIDTLLLQPTTVDHPDDAVGDKVFFIVNNLSSTNLDQKARELKHLLPERYFNWLANYIVMRRVSMEANFHNLYLQFIDTLNSPVLNAALLSNTYDCLRVLLKSEKIRSSTSERTLLKNLGSWLGLITLAKNKPLLTKDIDLKALIIEAYDRARLIAVVPFVCKVLDACKSSKIFKPPNPWVMAIVSLLGELHNFSDLKMNLKFEVAALAKSLAIELAELKPTALLADRFVDKIDNNDWTGAREAPPATPEAFRPPPGIGKPDLGTPLQAQPAVPATTPAAAAGEFAALAGQLVIPAVELFTQFPALKRFIAVAASNAIREIIAPVVERSVTIACITTRVLTLKDFSLETDESRLLNAAHTMVRSLSGSLALVTTKEPLRLSLANHLKPMLLQQLNVDANPALAQLVEVAVAQVVHENIEIACKFIEDSATEKAVRDVDENLSQTNRMRRTHREKTGQPLYDTTGFTMGRYPTTIPDELKPLPSGLTATQLRLYDDFAILRKRNEAAWARPDADKENLTQAEVMDKFKQIWEQLDLSARSSTHASLASVPADSDLRQILAFVPGVLHQAQANVRQECAVQVAQRLLSAMLGTTTLSLLHIDVYASALESLREFVPSLPKQLSEMAGVDEKFSPNVLAALLRYQLISVPDEVAKRLAKPRNDTDQDVDPPGFMKQVVALFYDWMRVYQRGAPGQEKAYTSFLYQLQQANLLKGDELTFRFFRIITEYCIERFYMDQLTSTTSSWDNIDAFCKLGLFVIKYSADSAGVATVASLRISLFNKMIAAAVRVLSRDHDSKAARMSQRPYFRLFNTWLTDFISVDAFELQTVQIPLLTCFCHSFYLLAPTRLPAFAFSWLDLVSHRTFMPRLLASAKCTPMFQQLMLSLLTFLEPYLRSVQLNDSVHQLYKGTLRVLLVLLHDFPEFLCEYSFSFCDVIPSTCIQLRNLILSAFPRNMRLPDPFTPHLKVDLLPEIQESPHISSNYQAELRINSLRADLDTYLRSRHPSTFLQELPSLLMAGDVLVRGTRFNVAAINALVLHVGVQAIAQMQTPQGQHPTILQTAPIEIFVSLATELSAEGRYLFLNAVANHLRYPNSHTHYFSWVLLYLFSETKNEVIQEQITRVLLERLIVNRPHPWGLLITFIELIKNPRYNFWQHRFVRCAPEIERLFDHVARNCVGVQAPQHDPADLAV